MQEKVKEIFDVTKFLKTFIKKLIINSIWVGIFGFILLDISQEYFPDILRILVVLLLVYLLVKKVHLDSLSETFMLGKINSDDIDKIKKRIIIVYCFLLLIGVIGALGNYFLSLGAIHNLNSAGLVFESLTGSVETMKSNAMHNLVINIVIQIIIETGLAFICIYKFKKEIEKPENIVKIEGETENENKKVNLISFIGAIIGVAIIAVIGIVYDFNEIDNKNKYNDIPSELKVPQVYILQNYVDKYNKINVGMSEEDVIAILGEPTSVYGNNVKIISWKDEYRNSIQVNIIGNKVDRVVLNIYSRSSAGIKLSSEIGTEIEDIEVLREQLRYGMTFEEATQILGDRYIETAKGAEDIIYDWYDKKENHIDIIFKDGIITEISKLKISY